MSTMEIRKRGEPVLEQTRTAAMAAMAPPVDVYEDTQELLLVADLPGVAKDAVRIELEKGLLTIEGRRPTPTVGEQVAGEYRIADFQRVFSVPPGIDATKIDAELSGGVLRVRLPKSEGVKPRRIEVRAS